MRKRAVYLKAAESLSAGNDEYSCCAILWASGEIDELDEKRMLTKLYTKTMSPRSDEFLFISDIKCAINCPYDRREARDFRVLLLCMMAAAVYDL